MLLGCCVPLRASPKWEGDKLLHSPLPTWGPQSVEVNNAYITPAMLGVPEASDTLQGCLGFLFALALPKDIKGGTTRM